MRPGVPKDVARFDREGGGSRVRPNASAKSSRNPSERMLAYTGILSVSLGEVGLQADEWVFPIRS
jgi:hypothetical protein